MLTLVSEFYRSELRDQQYEEFYFLNLEDDQAMLEYLNIFLQSTPSKENI